MKTFMRFIIKDGERHYINKRGVFNHEINDKYLHIEDKFFEEFPFPIHSEIFVHIDE